ncbi:hypothetical protein PHLCEN_2v12707 [Hermanssonia centrifuga]|uniref:Uncharacterized protein n=1 Tax=Hermanssonia centrifuga TaxID=98765 RepID=A0A2R6NGD0_9APHY|nr:hypothetical protein PHLCEN_2v12707 [Hermanssonia centrifuga]
MKAENILLTHFSARYPKMPQSEVASVPLQDGQMADAVDSNIIAEVAISKDKVYSVLEDRYARSIDFIPPKIDRFVRASAPPVDLSATEQSLLIDYPSKPVLALAFDHARIRIGEMRKLRAYLPAIEQTFAETAEKEDEDINPMKGSW